MQHFKTLEISDEKIQIEVTTGGKFAATFNEIDYTAATFDELVEQLKAAVKASRKFTPIEVTVLGMVPKAAYRGGKAYADGDGYVHALLRGYHERNRVYLMSSASTKDKFQLGGYGSNGVIARRLTDTETVEYKRLLEARRVAVTALEDFIGKHKIDARNVLAAAMGKADRDGK